MNVSGTTIEGVMVFEPRVFDDNRGFFMETYQKERYKQAGIDCHFVQDNLSYSVQGTLRGLHYQLHHPQAKLIQVIYGAIFDISVDIRRGSSTFGKWTGVHILGKNRRQVFVPVGFAHGFCIISNSAYVLYKCSDFYKPEDEMGILWSDPEIAIEWPISDPLLSVKDREYPCLSDVPENRLPLYETCETKQQEDHHTS